jgi:hypothetical protein
MYGVCCVCLKALRVLWEAFFTSPLTFEALAAHVISAYCQQQVYQQNEGGRPTGRWRRWWRQHSRIVIREALLASLILYGSKHTAYEKGCVKGAG